METLHLKMKNKAKRAFTLIEIMVATVIMVVLVGLVIQITSEVLKVWSRSSGKLAANAEARIAMDMITQDLETAVFRNNDLQWLRSEDDTVSGPAGTSNATVALRLFSPALDRPDGPGDICAIAYKLDYLNAVTGTATGDRLFVLYRLVVNPKDTFNALMGTANQKSLPNKAATVWTGTDANTGTVFNESLVGVNGVNYLVSNIVEFEIEFHVQDDGDPDTVTLITDAAGTIYGGQTPTVGPQAYPSAAPTALQLAYRQPLAYAEVKLTVISDAGAQMLENIANIPETVDEVIQQYGDTFIRRVNFMAHPL
jgi:prepilin-type N-terminal cleavage/methylation domain-containing protein